MGKPSVILRSQFTVPTAKSFTNYMNYITRKEAIMGNRTNEISLDETKELELINKSLSDYDMKYSVSQLEKKSDNAKDPKEDEALELLNSKQLFENQSLSYEKYLSYMSRYYAIENKKNKTELEKLEQRVVRKKISETTELLIPDKVNNKIYSGVFTKESNELNSEQFNESTEIVKKAQKNGSVFFQDVISFDNEFLEKENILNSKTGQLDEKRLRNASIKMMDKMFDSEDINSGFWIASIHRNTKHIHIHYASVETVNTRKTVQIEKDNEILYEPKGKRKQKTIDEMKSTFSNSLIDRTAQLSRISDLRNTLVQDIKEKYNVTNKKEAEQIKLIKGIYENLPSNKKKWNYKNISESSPKAKKQIDLLTKSLMFDNANYQEYITKVTDESSYRKELFGETSRDDKDYLENKKTDINKRLGNSLLKEMKVQTNKSVLAKSIPLENISLNQSNKTYEKYTDKQLEYLSSVLRYDEIFLLDKTASQDNWSKSFYESYSKELLFSANLVENNLSNDEVDEVLMEINIYRNEIDYNKIDHVNLNNIMTGKEVPKFKELKDMVVLWQTEVEEKNPKPKAKEQIFKDLQEHNSIRTGTYHLDNDDRRNLDKLNLRIKQSTDILEGRTTEYPKVEKGLEKKANNLGIEKENVNYNKVNYENKNKNHTKPFVNKINLYEFKRALNDDYDKYRAENDYEQLKKRIALEQERNTL